MPSSSCNALAEPPATHSKASTDVLLDQHKHATALLYAEPHDPRRHMKRGSLHEQLGYHDLAAADAYRALTLWESVVDPEGSEFHARRRRKPRKETGTGGGDEEEDDEELFQEYSLEEYHQNVMSVYAMLVRSLVRCGCFRDAYEFCIRGLEVFSGMPQGDGYDDGGRGRGRGHVTELQEQMKIIKMEYIRQQHRAVANPSSDLERDIDSVEVNQSALKAQGFARRVLYPWNTHEPDRKAPETLQLLNDRLRDVAPKCEVRAVALPALHNQTDRFDAGDVSVQLGLFAKEDIAPGEVLLRESSLLTATNRLHDDLCDACNSPLPDLSAEDPPVPCEECADTVFCSQKCHDLAQTVYHRAVCGLDGLESIGKDIPDPKDKADYLYLLLLGRAIAMAATQGMHPLDLPEVKYIWGDFHDPDHLEHEDPQDRNNNNNNNNKVPADTATLPFSFQLNILQPLRILEEMELDPFATLPLYDTWVLNTLYAKFRGTASGRLSTWDGGPEVCAVHPLWCLANHSCDPNVRWEWGGEITFVARRKAERAVWKNRPRPRDGRERGLSVDDDDADDGEGEGEGIRKDREILNHYCDIGLGVKDRREWARGALGGFCQCERCIWEASLEEDV